MTEALHGIPTLPWWQSRAILGALVTVAANLATLIGMTIDVEQTTELLIVAAGLVGGVVAWYGRLKATRPISMTKIAPGVTLEKP